MSEESTQLLPAPFLGGPAGVGPYPVDDDDDAHMNAMEKGRSGGETDLDTSQRPAESTDAATRGRERQRGTASRHPRVNAEADLRYLASASDVACALNAALGGPLQQDPSNAVIPDNTSLDSVRHLHRDESPEKKQRLSSKMPAFGGGYPPLFHGDSRPDPPPAVSEPPTGNAVPSGRVPSPGLATAAAPSLPPQVRQPLQSDKATTQHFHLDEPTWVGSIREQLGQLVQVQHTMSTQIQDSGRNLRDLQTEIRRLNTGQEGLSRRTDQQEANMQQMQRDLKELEKELQALKSSPPTRSVSPAPTRGPGPSTPRSDPLQMRDVDELQIVIGGWNECKRDDIEADVRQIFALMNAAALVHKIYVPYVRCGYCRVDLLYPEPNIWAQRKLQGIVVQAIKDLKYKSQAPEQQQSTFWAARNRSLQERAKIRAILSTQELCIKHVGDAIVDRDWRGKVWVANTQVLHHIEYRSRPSDSLMLMDARGNETGWYLDIPQMQAVLGTSRQAILSHFDMH